MDEPTPVRSRLRWAILLSAWAVGLAVWGLYIAVGLAAFFAIFA